MDDIVMKSSNNNQKDSNGWLGAAGSFKNLTMTREVLGKIRQQRELERKEFTEADKERIINGFSDAAQIQDTNENNRISAEVKEQQRIENERMQEEQRQRQQELLFSQRVASPQEQVATIANENRRFNILQRERAINEARSARTRSALIAGACILGAGAAVWFGGVDPKMVIEHELQAVYSWEALGQYFQDLGPLATMLYASAGGFIAKSFKNSMKYRKLQNEFNDFNASLENSQTLGGNENGRTR